jgi:tRNA pseudouridine55 synthase
MNKKHFRNIDGILLLDKPIGITSNAALQKVKDIYKAAKAGHTGSLDPLATGMLPICFGEATKFSQFLLEADKAYTVTAKLGVETETGDMEGKIVTEKPVEKFSKSDLTKTLNSFVGKIEQLPSMYSAIKHNGEPLYKLARKGITVERQKRAITVYSLELLDFGKDFFSIKVHCSKGTYIRTLVEDIGKAMGAGAHVTTLRRLSVANFKESELVTMEQLETLVKSGLSENLDKLILPLEVMLSNYPILQIPENLAFYLRQGQPIIIPKAPTTGLVMLKLSSGRFLGVGEILDDGKVAPKRLVK